MSTDGIKGTALKTAGKGWPIELPHSLKESDKILLSTGNAVWPMLASQMPWNYPREWFSSFSVWEYPLAPFNQLMQT